MIPAQAGITYVVAAIIINHDGQLLINTRPANKRFAGCWEFPGGKVESGETQSASLVRELREELDLDLSGVVFHHLLRKKVSLTETSDTKSLMVDFYHCQLPKALCPRPLEGQSLAWAKLEELEDYDFIPSNLDVLAQLPQLLPQ
ncbi:MAG: (deoxy)nucleoside triphosphate pyrophosphohydrolase [Cardiobacteriaceae bacterium]|nr:(deoxy)nucleoside triphosphate pyrophosphohydrolase [Cardiobacteriaceae bacterium]